MSVRKHNTTLRKRLPLFLTGFYTIACICLFLLSGPHWMHQNGDVNYTYLFAGLDYLSFHTASINDQPAIVTKLVNAICIGITYTIRSWFVDTTITRDVISHSETYLNIISFGVFGFVILSFYRFLKTCFDASKRIEVFLISSLGMFFSFITVLNVFANKPEPYLLIASCLLGTILVKTFVLKKDISSLEVLLCAFIGVLSKITFAPFILPLILACWSIKHLTRTLPIALVLGSVVLYFWRFELTQFVHFIANTATHSGAYGAGDSGFYNFSQMSENILKIVNVNKILIVSLVTGFAIALYQRKRIKVISYILISYLVLFVFLLKSPNSHYFIACYPLVTAYLLIALQDINLSAHTTKIALLCLAFLGVRAGLYARTIHAIHSDTTSYIAPNHIQTYYSSTKEYACFQANACQEYRHSLLLTEIYPRDTFYTTLGELRTMGKRIDLGLMEGKVFTIEGTSEYPKNDNHFTVLNESKDGIKREYTVQVTNPRPIELQ